MTFRRIRLPLAVVGAACAGFLGFQLAVALKPGTSPVPVATLVSAAILSPFSVPTPTPASTQAQVTTTPASPNGTPFTDPDGTYTLSISDSWVDATSAFPKAIEGWWVGPAENGFRASVNVLTERAPGMTLSEYLTASLAHLGDLKVVSQTTVTGADGQQLAFLEYTGVTQIIVKRSMHWLAVISLENGVAAVATLSALETDFATLRPQVEPYLLTLHSTGTAPAA